MWGRVACVQVSYMIESRGFYPDLGVFHVKSGVLLLLRVWLQQVATAVASDLPRLVVLAIGVVVICCNQLQLWLMWTQLIWTSCDCCYFLHIYVWCICFLPWVGDDLGWFLIVVKLSASAVTSKCVSVVIPKRLWPPRPQERRLLPSRMQGLRHIEH